MKSNKYTMSGSWTIQSNYEHQPYIYLENQKKGKIIIDKTIKNVMESFNANTLAEMNQKKMVSNQLLEIISKVFYRVGVLGIASGTDPNHATADIDPDKKNQDKKNLSQFPLVSIVIINRCHDEKGSNLSELVHSIYKQCYQNCETIIVDIIDTGIKKRNAQQLKRQYQDIKVLELKQKTGFAQALNKGIKIAEGDFILCMNSNIVLDENAVYEMMKMALAKEKWAAISPKIKYFNNPSFIHSIGKTLFPYFGMGKNYSGCVDFGQFDDHIESVSASFSAALLNRKIIKEIGMADPFYKSYYEDLDWCFRARVQGFPVFNAPHAVAYYKDNCPHMDLIRVKSRCFRTLYQVGNRLYFVVKNLERKSFCRFLANYIAEDIKSMLIHLKRKQFPLFLAYLRSYIRLIPYIPSLFYKRINIQRKRKIRGDAAFLAETAPFYFLLEENGIPKLDTHALRTYYSFLLCLEQNRKTLGMDGGGDANDHDIIVWQERTACEDEKSREKLYFEFNFTIKRSGTFDVYLLGFARKGSKVYLDNHRIDQKLKGNKKNRMLFTAARNIYIPEGKHYIELERKNHVREIILRRSHI